MFALSMARVDKKNDINGTPVFGVTKFSDWSEEEFQVLLGRKDRAVAPTSVDVRKPGDAAKFGRSVLTSAPAVVEWFSAVTPVKNQGQCGSCWAFSAAEEIESQWIMDGNAVWEFSPQQIASCTTNCFGCGGGDTVAAYEYLIGTLGLGSAWYAPYVQSMYTSCSGKRCTNACSNYDMTDLSTYSSLTGPYAAVTGYSYATAPCTSGACAQQNTTLLAENTATYGPVSICVDASLWNDYTGGVLTQAACGGFSAKSIDHCVQLVGYNAEASSPYWIVRNSWATNWGENGYIYLEYPANSCGLANEATFVTLGNSIANFTSSTA